MRHEKITRKLISFLNRDDNLKRLVEKSLDIARSINPDKKTNPAQSLEELYDFIDWSVKCMPWGVLREKNYDTLFNAMDQATGYFWYIFDQPLDELRDRGFYYPSLQYLEPIASWIKDYSKVWGKYLSKRKSWNEKFYKLALKNEAFGLQKGWYGSKNIWHSYNDFFCRKLINPTQRPISEVDVIAPADSLPMGFYKIDKNNKLINNVNIKSANLNDVGDLIGKNSKYYEAFSGGTLTHTFLNMNDYHRYHFPIDGKIVEMRKIKGANAGGGITEWDKVQKKYVYYNETGFQMIETRHCVILQTEKFGLVAVLPIGMSQVCSVNFENYLKEGTVVKKGDPMGFFQFGGSDIVMILQKHVKVKDLTLKDNKGNPKHLLMGEPYASLSIK